jgi:hypothetical protein
MSLRQVLCGLHGHDRLVQFERNRMYMRCVSCGHETPGWTLKESKAPTPIRPAVRRQPLAATEFMTERRIA